MEPELDEKEDGQESDPVSGCTPRSGHGSRSRDLIQRVMMMKMMVMSMSMSTSLMMVMMDK
jgi:hypothetical protein